MVLVDHLFEALRAQTLELCRPQSAAGSVYVAAEFLRHGLGVHDGCRCPALWIAGFLVNDM